MLKRTSKSVTTAATKRQASAKGRKKSKNRTGRWNNFSPTRFVLLVVVTVLVVLLAREDFFITEIIDGFNGIVVREERRPTVEFTDDFHAKTDYLAMLYPEGREVVYLDVMTIQAIDWEYERMIIGGHDQLNRTLPITAFLSQRNLGRSEGRGSQTHNPTGWQQNQFTINGSSVWVKNRGHLIAYTLTFNFNADGQFVYGYPGSENDPRNLFTQTAHSNQNVMTRYEAQIRSILAGGGEIVFKAAPIFRDDELMARGIWLQAASTCGDLLFSVFIFNEQPGVVIDHATGENWVYGY